MGPGTIIGFVVERSSGENQPVPGVSVWIRQLGRTVITSEDGNFRFDNVPPGTYDIRARRIGYKPGKESTTVPGGHNVVFVLNPIPATLVPIISSAVLGGVQGVIIDTSHKPVQGVLVRIVGEKNRRALSDSAGAFHIDLPAGQYLAEVDGKGMVPDMLSFTIPPDSGRMVIVTVRRGKLPAREAVARKDMVQRVAWRKMGAKLYTREDLAAMRGKSLLDLVRAVATEPFDDNCFPRLNGHFSAWPMWMYDAEDLDMVEVYPVSTQGNQSRNAGDRRRQTRAARELACPSVFIWQRG